LALSISRDCGNAVSAVVSVCVGRGCAQQQRRAVTTACLLGSVSAAVMTGLLLLGLDFILRLLRVPVEIYPQARVYLLLFAAAVPFVVAFQIFGALLRAVGNSHVTSAAMAVSTIINVVLDLVFVLVLHWSVVGAATATFLAHAVSGLITMYYVAKTPQLRPNRNCWNPDWALLREIGKLCLPMFLNSVVTAAGGLLVQSCVNEIGAYFTAGISVGTKMFKLLEAVIIAVQTAASVFIGQNLGAMQPERIRTGMKRIVRATLGFTVVIIGLSWLFEGFMLSCFLSPDDGSLYELTYEVARTDMRIMMSGSIFAAPMYLYRAATQTLGKPVFTMYAGVMQLVIRLVCVFWLPDYIGSWAYYLPTVLAWMISLPMVQAAYCHCMRKRFPDGKAD